MAPAHRRCARSRRVRGPDLDLDGLRGRHRRRPAAARALPQRDARRPRSSTSSPPSPRHWTTRTSAACCTATSNPPTSCSPIPESGDQRILLADFGIARWANDISGLTATNMTVGTRVVRGTRAADGRTARRAGRSIRVGGHRLSPADRCSRRFRIPIRQSSSASTCPRRRLPSAHTAPSCPHSIRCWPRRCPRIRRIVSSGARTSPVRWPTGLTERRRVTPSTTLAPAATPPRRSLLRAGVVVPAILAVLLIAAITVALMEFRRADRPEVPSTATAKPPTATSPTFTPPPPPPPEPAQPPPTSVSEASPTTAATTPAAPPAVVIGANCSPVGSTATTAQGPPHTARRCNRAAPRFGRCNLGPSRAQR